MRIAICEDNKTEQDYLVNSINQWSDASKIPLEIFRYDSAEQFLFIWMDVKFEIIFIDIMMEKMNGITLAKKIRESDPYIQIIFTTHHKQFSLKGYDVFPLHYLVKPVSKEQLNSVLDKVYSIYSLQSKDAIILSNGSEAVKLHASKIFYIQMKSHIAEFHLEKEVFTQRKTSRELIDMLPTCFIRCHRTYIVNLLHIDCVYSKEVLLSNGIKLPVSRSEAKNVFRAFADFYQF